MKTPLTIECEFHIDRKGRGSRKVLETGPKPYRPAESGRVPRVARLMALAIRCEGLIRDGVIENYTEIGRLGHVTRARVTQIMNLLHLAPDIQEEILFLPRTERGRADHSGAAAADRPSAGLAEATYPVARIASECRAVTDIPTNRCDRHVRWKSRSVCRRHVLPRAEISVLMYT
jgi:hypothetical protein